MGVVSGAILNAGSPHMRKGFAENGNVKSVYLKTFMNIKINDNNKGHYHNLQNNQRGKKQVVNTAMTRRKLRQGQTMEVQGSGPVTVLKSFKVTFPNESQGVMEDADNSAVQVLKDANNERGENFIEIISQETKKDENVTRKDIDGGCNSNKILKTNRKQQQFMNMQPGADLYNSQICWQPDVDPNNNLDNADTMGEEWEDTRTAVEVIEEIRKQRQIKEPEKSNKLINLQAYKTITNKEVKLKRMKKVVRTKRNANGKILSQETVMIDLNSEEEAAFRERSAHITLESQTSNMIDLTSEEEAAFGERSAHEVLESQICTNNMMKNKQEGERAVVLKKNRRTVEIEPYQNNAYVASGLQFKSRTNREDTRRTVRIDNLSLSTSDNTIKALCGCAGPFQDFKRAGQSAFVVYMDSRNALKFKNKYDRHMLDLSVLSVELIEDFIPMK
ncbi:uncharacterized protein LOC127737394 isoform X2 [Mytilus californianus]|nr:uncharacterized protein LOC127737394 isoform X2 [Mytilus californianus]